MARVIVICMSNLNQWAEHTLNKTKECVIDSFAGPLHLQERLREMGLSTGLVIKIKGRAPWKGPWLIEYSETVLAIREQEAQCLIVKSL